MNTNEHNNQPDNEPVVKLPGDERDVLVSRIIDGIASSEDWNIFRAVASHDPSIWSELADIQQMHKSLSDTVEDQISIADQIELPGGLIDDEPLRTKLDLVSRWGGWAAAAAILLVWLFGKPAMLSNQIDSSDKPDIAGLPGSGLIGSKMLLDQAQPDQAFDRYLSSGQSTGQVVGEMPEQIVIETRPMPDGSIEVLYLRQIIERQVIDHAYREVHNEAGQIIPVPVKLEPKHRSSY